MGPKVMPSIALWLHLLQPSQVHGRREHPGQDNAQGGQVANHQRLQGPDLAARGVSHQHPEWQHGTAAPSEASAVQACRYPESPQMH